MRKEWCGNYPLRPVTVFWGEQALGDGSLEFFRDYTKLARNSATKITSRKDSIEELLFIPEGVLD